MSYLSRPALFVCKLQSPGLITRKQNDVRVWSWHASFA